ncbi:MAG: MscS family membrane protein [Gammaproteobacteria bacterium]|jgi:MscS family membrane protein
MEQVKIWLGFGEDAAWYTELFIVVLAVVIVNLLVRVVLIQLEKGTKKTANTWDDSFFHAINAPLRLVVWLVGLSIAASLAAQKVDAAPIFDLVDPARKAGILVAIGWFITRLVREMEAKMIIANTESGGQKGMDKHTAEAMSKLLRVTVMITLTLAILQTLGFSVSGVLAFGGVGGIAIGFAARDLLANFFGGLMIYLDKPFAVGDWIRSPDKQIEGTVENIGWRRTMIRKFDKRPLYVPNQFFNNISVENPSRMTNRRIYETIGVRYIDHSKVTSIVDEIRQMLIEHDEIDTNQTMIVNFNAFGSHSLDFFIYTFTKTTAWVRYHEIKHEILLGVYDIIRSHDGDMAFPTQTVYLERDGDEQQTQEPS